MSSFVKYKIREVAKDFDLPPKTVVGLVGEYFEAPKSSAQVLTDEQLNVVFDRITRDHQIDSIEEVFAAAKPAQPDEPELLVVEDAPAQPEAKPQARPQGGQQPQGNSLQRGAQSTTRPT